MSQEVKSLFAGRWQIPLALAAAVVAGVSVYRLLPVPPRTALNLLLADVTALENAGDPVAAMDAVANLLAEQPPRPPEEQVILHDRAAALLYRMEAPGAEHSAANLRNLLEHDRQAREGGAPLTWNARMRGAYAHLWLKEPEEALTAFRELLAADLPASERPGILRTVANIVRRGEVSGERRELIADVVRDAACPPDVLWWGVQTLVDDALAHNDPTEARAALDRFGAPLSGPDLKGYGEYLTGEVEAHAGRFGAAEAIARWVDEWLATASPSRRAALDQFGDLESMNGWLLARAVLAQHRPDEALALFDRLAGLHAGPAQRAAHAGRANALIELGRYDEALEALALALDAVRNAPLERRRLLEDLAPTLVQVVGDTAERGDHAHALAFFDFAARLPVGEETVAAADMAAPLGQLCAAAANRTPDSDVVRQYRQRAAAALERAARRRGADELVRGDLLAAAAAEYDRLGQARDMRRLLEEFVNTRSDHPRLPAVLLQLGRACELADEPQAALRYYQRLIDDYPQLELAARAKVGAAGVLTALGEEHYAAAREMLGDLLNSDAVAPDAAAYHDALLALAELLFHEHSYGPAIGRFEEFLALYPQDAEAGRVRFLIADAHRRSAYALRDTGRPDALAESQRRFQTAAELYGALVQERDESAAGVVDDPYARQALLYRGDCLFELNQPETLQAAIAAYRAAAARYQGQPAALTAQVQITNALLRLGDTAGAARAIESARWLLRSIPDTRRDFTAADRTAWDRYLNVVAGSDLLKD